MKYLLTLFLSISVFTVFSQMVSVDRAKYKAITFFQDIDRKKDHLKSASPVSVDLFLTYSDRQELPLKSATSVEEPAFYIFNRTDKSGFVIISGDERISDIIAWSDHSGICEVNPAQKLLFEQYNKEITLARSQKLSSPEVFPSQQEVLEPLLRNIEWSQSPAPFNSFCPIDRATGRTCPVGCVATALAQVIYYFKYPRVGTGSMTYASDYGVLSVNFANAEYNYETMSDKPVMGVANADIAELCYHSAVSLETDFGPYESSAYEGNVATALYKYFKYKQPSFRYLTNYTFDSWKSMINKEILNNRPVIYGALDPLDPNKPEDVAGGHAFILDGFTNEDQYHINWGWGGCSNGFYRLNLLTPSQCGDIYTFSDLHMMVIGIEPATTFECLMSVNKDSLQFEVSGGQRTINISSNTNWKIQEIEPWINISSLSGTGNKTLVIDVHSNEGFLDRVCNIKITGCDEDRIIRVVQKGTCALSLSADTLNFTISESKRKVGINATSSWMTSSDSPWLTVLPGVGGGKDSLLIAVTDNMGSSRRSGRITVFGCNSYKTITVIQDGTCSLVVSTNSLVFNSHVSNQSVAVTSGTFWTVTSGADWISVSPTTSEGNGTITVNVSENTTNNRRTGTISVKGCNADRTITVVQNGICFMELATQNVEFDPDAGYKFIKIFSNSDWKAVTETCWITVTPTNGNENDYIKIQVEPNTGQSSRLGSIEITGCDFTRQILIIQHSYCLLDVTTNLLDFTYYEGTKSGSIISTGIWSVAADAPWISVTPYNGRKLGEFTVSVPANSSSVKRSGTITITGCYTTKNVTVTQDACSFLISDQKLSFLHEQGQKVLTIKSNSAWTASADSKWVTVTPTFGTENGTISVIVDNNPLQKRNAYITITGCFASQLVNVFQEGNPTPVTTVDDTRFRIYPTPTSRFVKIELPAGVTDCSLEVFSESGQKILSKEKIRQSDEMDLQGMSKGVYYFKIFSSRFAETRKIILR